MDLKSIVIIALTLAVILGGRHMADEIARRLEAIPPADVELLARLIEAEAGGESYRGKVAVGAVVINRYLDDRYPDTVRDVIYQPNQFYVEGIALHPNPSAESRRAAQAAVRGEDPTGGALFFYNPRTARLSSWWSSRTVVAEIGNHVFLR